MNPVLDNVHPGDLLLERFLTPMGISQNGLTRNIGTPPRRVSEIVHGQSAVRLRAA
jgi:addiction module HigA family antidote